MKVHRMWMAALVVTALACGDRDRNPQQSAEAERAEARRDIAAEQPDVAMPQDQAAPTASDQPENQADRDLAAAIRQQLMADSSLSTAAHNVTIVSEGSNVTLRGQVESQDEKSRVEAAARQTPGVSAVDNLIEVAEQ